MDTRIGKQKAAAWRASGKLEEQPDPITGSTEAHMKEFKVFFHMGRAISNTKKNT